MSDSHVEIRPAPWWLFVLVLAAVILMIVLSSSVPSGLWKPLYQRTYGLLNLWFLVYFLVVVCGVLLGVGRRRPAELGLESRKLPAAALYTCGVWIGLQVALAGWYLAFESLEIANGWAGVGLLRKAGELLGQLLGNALNEEIVFRGFFLMQIVIQFRARWPDQPRKSVVVSLVVVTALFAVLHVPDRLMRHSYTSLSAVADDQIELFVTGCIFGWIFWQTRNLFFVVGVHALSNLPTTLIAWHNLGPLTRADPVVLFLGVVIAAAWRRLPATERKPT